MTIGNVIPSCPPGSAILILFSHCFLITSCADSSKNKKKAVNIAPVFLFVTWGVDGTFLSLIITLEEKPLDLHASRWEDKGDFSFMLVFCDCLHLAHETLLDLLFTCLISCKIKAG